MKLSADSPGKGRIFFFFFLRQTSPSRECISHWAWFIDGGTDLGQEGDQDIPFAASQSKNSSNSVFLEGFTPSTPSQLNFLNLQEESAQGISQKAAMQSRG